MNKCYPCVSKIMQKCEVKGSTRRWKVEGSSFHQEGRLWLRAASRVGEGLQLTIVSDLPQGHPSPRFGAARQALHIKSHCAVVPLSTTHLQHTLKKKIQNTPPKQQQQTIHSKIDFCPFDLMIKEVLSDFFCITMQRITNRPTQKE